MRALCAARVSRFSCGMALASICWLRLPALVSCSTFTPVILLPWSVTWTCIGPYWVLTTAPVRVRVAAEPPVPPCAAGEALPWAPLPAAGEALPRAPLPAAGGVLSRGAGEAEPATLPLAAVPAPPACADIPPPWVPDMGAAAVVPAA